MSGKLAVAEGWRKTILDWRMSFAEVLPAWIRASSRCRSIRAVKGSRYLPTKWRSTLFMGSDTNSHAYKAGLRESDIITAVNGESPNLIARAFLSWFVHKFDPAIASNYRCWIKMTQFFTCDDRNEWNRPRLVCCASGHSNIRVFSKCRTGV
jgi:hypothetical protein